MPAGIVNTGAFTQSWSKDFDKVFLGTYSKFPDLYTKVANVTSTEDAYIKEGQLTGLQALQELDEGQPIGFESPVQGNEKTVYMQKFGLGVQFTEESIDDDRTGHFRDKFAKELGLAAAYTQELKFWDLLNSGFVTTTRTGIDGLALFTASHLLEKNGVTALSNIGTSGALSMATIQAGITAFRKMKNYANVPMVSKPDKLIIPPDLEWKAKELMLSPYNPENANNAVNVLKGEGLTYIVVPYLTSTTAYFLLDSTMHDLRFIWRKKVKTQPHMDFNTGNLMMKATCRFQTTFYHWRGAWGNAGA